MWCVPVQGRCCLGVWVVWAETDPDKSLSRKHSWRVQARRSIIGVGVCDGKFGGSSSSSEAKRASGVRIPVRRDSLLAKRASEGEGGEVAREARGSLAKRAVCARVEKKNRDKP